MGGEDFGDRLVQASRKGLAAPRAARDDLAVGDLGRVEQRFPGGPVAQGLVPPSARVAASSYLRRGCAPWIVSTGSPPTNTITVGSESTP